MKRPRPDSIDYHGAMLYTRDVQLLAPGKWLNDNVLNFGLRFFEFELFRSSSDSNSSSSSGGDGGGVTASTSAAPEAAPTAAAAATAAPVQVIFVDPCVTSCLMLQCDDEEEMRDIRTGLGIDWSCPTALLVPVNDNDSFTSGSSHWSLLLICTTGPAPSQDQGQDERQNQRQDGLTVLHYDSSRGHNNYRAEAVAAKMAQLLRLSLVEPLSSSSSESAEEAHPASSPLAPAPSPLLPATRAVAVRHVAWCPQQTDGWNCGTFALVVARWAASRLLRSAPASQGGSSEQAEGGGGGAAAAAEGGGGSALAQVGSDSEEEKLSLAAATAPEQLLEMRRVLLERAQSLFAGEAQ